MQFIGSYDIETGRSYDPPTYVKGVVAATGEEVCSLEDRVDFITVGPDGTVYLSDDGDLITMNPNLSEVKWRTRLGSTVSHQASFDSAGSLFAPLRDGRLVAIDAASGRLRWTYSSGEDYYFTGQVTVEDGLVVAKTKHGGVIAIRD